MIFKVFRGVWFLSVLMVLANLLWVYAGLPERVLLFEDGITARETSREVVFYGYTALVLFVNVLVYLVARLSQQEDFKAWFYGLIVTMNFFFVITLSVIQTSNSGDRFDFSKITVILYGSVIFIAVWALSWPVYSIFRKSSPKQTLS